mmetsp:Transcript_11689/g.37487  ORF Transcript_11689/g.37487 Transcript_11689/m.37487 type:complete len:275 (+) Transcript_11689:217-1041(+)
MAPVSELTEHIRAALDLVHEAVPKRALACVKGALHNKVGVRVRHEKQERIVRAAAARALAALGLAARLGPRIALVDLRCAGHELGMLGILCGGSNDLLDKGLHLGRVGAGEALFNEVAAELVLGKLHYVISHELLYHLLLSVAAAVENVLEDKVAVLVFGEAVHVLGQDLIEHMPHGRAAVGVAVIHDREHQAVGMRVDAHCDKLGLDRAFDGAEEALGGGKKRFGRFVVAKPFTFLLNDEVDHLLHDVRGVAVARAARGIVGLHEQLGKELVA